jgi:hypothetical protein
VVLLSALPLSVFTSQINPVTLSKNLCGGNNWRVPTAEELESIVDLSIIKLTIDSDYFPDATAMVDVYSWSSSISIVSTECSFATPAIFIVFMVNISMGAVSGITICTTTISFYFPNQGFDFTKLGSTGNVLSIQNAAWIIGGTGTESAGTKWSCVRDNVRAFPPQVTPVSLSILTSTGALGVAVTSLDLLLSKVSLTAVMINKSG